MYANLLCEGLSTMVVKKKSRNTVFNVEYLILGECLPKVWNFTTKVL